MSMAAPPIPRRPSAPPPFLGVRVNQSLIDNFKVMLLQEAAGIQIENGDYWYDKQVRWLEDVIQREGVNWK